MRIQRIGWWTLASLNSVVPLLGVTAAVVALNAGGRDECANASAAQHVASSLIGAAVVLIPLTLLLDLAAGVAGRHRMRWRRLTTIGAVFCLASVLPLLIATLALTSVCW